VFLSVGSQQQPLQSDSTVQRTHNVRFNEHDALDSSNTDLAMPSLDGHVYTYMYPFSPLQVFSSPQHQYRCLTVPKPTTI